ncbi:flagellar assembly protein FliH [Vibrio zhanjiangensis]|uniref:Flagellar assembly protein FliH n=1 Tax=Vibrio zhanjiangensis TaxID=1046128 RepID=A0ABQ6EW10_9VIBR|nr:flagellar assembly protein FliH [Vibrio zhanjiangensis]GLT17362.1 flagellar assembly protein FliH [Vibrio zhanjiangensis]
MSDERKRGYLRIEDGDLAHKTELWGMPDYSSETRSQAKETAMNYDPSWMPVLPEPEPEPPKELTEEEIEQIKRQAYENGLLQGQEAGFTQGFEKGKEQGLVEGHKEGFEEGKTEGIEAGQELVQQQIQTFVGLANQFAQPLELLNVQVERQIVDMVLTLVKEVVHVEAQINPKVVLDTVKQSVEALPVSGHSITIKLHPDDIDIVRSSYGEGELEFRNWLLAAEPALNRGDLQIEAGESSVNYRLEDRIRSVLNNFCGTNHHQGGD